MTAIKMMNPPIKQHCARQVQHTLVNLSEFEKIVGILFEEEDFVVDLDAFV